MRGGGGTRQRPDRPDARIARHTYRAAADPDAAWFRVGSFRRSVRGIQPALSRHPARHHRERPGSRSHRRRLRCRVSGLPRYLGVVDRAAALYREAALLRGAVVRRSAWRAAAPSRVARAHDGALFRLSIAQPLDDDARRRGLRNGTARHDPLELRASAARLCADGRRCRVFAYAGGERAAARRLAGARSGRLRAVAFELRGRVPSHATPGAQGEGARRISGGLAWLRARMGRAVDRTWLGTLAALCLKTARPGCVNKSRAYTVGTVPPSITYSVPLIADASGEARNAIRFATSAGFAGRPSGMPPSDFMMIDLPPS